MKKLVLAAILGLGRVFGILRIRAFGGILGIFVFGMLGVASLNAQNLAKNQTPQNAQNLSDEQLVKAFEDCLDNENALSCQRLIDSEQLAGVDGCGKGFCGDLGLVYELAQRHKQAAKYYEKACELGDELGCGNLSNLYHVGKGVQQDSAKALALAKKACDLGYEYACYNVGVSYENAWSVERSRATAKKYYGKACDLGHQKACELINR